MSEDAVERAYSLLVLAGIGSLLTEWGVPAHRADRQVSKLAALLVEALRPLLVSEALADLADELGEDFPALAVDLDAASHQIRTESSR